MNDRPDRRREPWDERPDWPNGQWDERPDGPQMPWDERPPQRDFGRPRRSPWAGREWDTATGLLHNPLTRLLFGSKPPRTKNQDAESRQPSPGQAD
jgi:hypothetical protein